MRNFATEALISWVKENKPVISKLAIVGGSAAEPELIELRKILGPIEVRFLGLEPNSPEEDFTFLDLNVRSEIDDKFDMVICAQVLEHVWNTSQAISNLSALLNGDRGLLWINCPASNMYHGSPDYYSAGYSPEMLQAQTSYAGLDSVISGFVGSRRMYFFTHALNYWPTEFELAHPLITYRPLRSYGKKFISETVLGFLGRLYSLLLNPRPSANPTYATESYILCEIKAN